MECVPRESDFVVHVAVPLASVAALHPEMVLFPSVNRTVPVGDTPPAIFTVNVTAWLNFDV